MVVLLTTTTPVAGSVPKVTLAPVPNPTPAIVTGVPPAVGPELGTMPLTDTADAEVGSVGESVPQPAVAVATTTAARNLLIAATLGFIPLRRFLMCHS
jgi:hypothetical protein